MAKKIFSSFHPIILETIKFLLASSLWVYSNGQIWAQGVFLSTGILLASMFIYLFLRFFSIFRKPLKILVNMYNSVTKNSHTDYYGQHKNGQYQRTVIMELSISKNKSFLSWIGLKLVARSKVYISFDTLPSGYMLLTPENTKGIINTQHGFMIDISDIFNEFLKEPNANFLRLYQFVIFKGRDVEINNNMEVNIIGRCKINDKNISFIHSLVYDIEIDEHKIKYFDNYMKR